MEPTLNEPEAPDVLAPDPHRPVAGDWHDDDGPALDAYFQPNPDGPDLSPVIDHFTNYNQSPGQVTRLISRSLPLPLGSGPVMLLPADPNRVFARVRFSNTVTVPQSQSSPGAQPSAYVIPTGIVTRKLLYYSFSIITDATAGNRTLFLSIKRGLAVICNMALPEIAPSSNLSPSYISDETTVAQANSGTPYGMLPTPILRMGDSIALQVIGIGATDTITPTLVFDRDAVRIAGGLSECYAADDIPTDTVWESEHHTGPLWAYAPNALDAMTIVVEAVTK